jgi:outer membrane protein TolC
MIGLHHQPEITASAGELAAAKGVTQQTKSGLHPSISLSASASDSSTLSASGSALGVNGVSSASSGVEDTAGISLRQLLYDEGHTNALLKQSQAQELAAGAALTQTQADTVLNVKQAFYTLVQDLRLVTVNEANYSSQLQHLALTRAQQQAGIGLVADVVKAQTTVSEAALGVNVARNNASVAGVDLVLAMGLDARTPITPADSDEPSPTTDDVNALVAEALTMRPEIISATANVKAAQAALTAAKTTNAPVIVGGVGAGGHTSGDPLDSSSVTIGAVVTWTPYDAGLTAGRIKQAQGQLATAEAQLTAEQQTVTSDVTQAYLNEKLAAQRLNQANDEVINAQESIALADGRYKAGVGIFLDVVDAQQALLTAQTDRVNAQSALDQGLAALAHATGQNLSTGAPAAPAPLPPAPGATSPPIEHAPR